MPRIRTLKGSFFRSRSVCRMPRLARLTLAGVITAVADDHGRFVADARLIRTEVFPKDDDVTDAEIEEHLTLAASRAVQLIRLYKVAGERYGCFPKWQTHQYIPPERVAKSFLPGPSARGSHANGMPVAGGSHAYSTAIAVQPHANGRHERNGKGLGKKIRERKGSGEGEGDALSKKRGTADDPLPGIGQPAGEVRRLGDTPAMEQAKQDLERRGVLEPKRVPA